MSIPVELSGIDTLTPYTVSLSGAPQEFAYNPETNAIEGPTEAAFDGDVEVTFEQGDTRLTSTFALKLTQSPDPEPGEDPTPGSDPKPEGGSHPSTPTQSGMTIDIASRPTMPLTGTEALWVALLSLALAVSGAALITARRRLN